MNPTVRPALAADADALVAVVRDGFDATFQETMTFGCTGMAQFLRDQLAIPPALCDSRYTVAAVGEQVVGAVDLRAAGGALVLNYIAVAPGHRSGGLARRLLAEAVAAFPSAGLSEMVLDVLTTNEAARRWYERLGFEPESETAWWQVEQTATPPGDARATVHGYPQAQAAHARFGFSQVDVATPTARHAVGRLGANWFRLTEAAALDDAALLDSLRRLDPQRRLLVLLRDDPAGAPPGGTLRATTSRMRAPLATLRDRLAGRTPH